MVSKSALGDDPFVAGAADIGDAFEVGVVVEHDESCGLCCCGYDQVRDRDAMLTATGKGMLEIDRCVEDLGRDGRGVEAAPLEEYRLVVGEVAAAVENLEINNRTRRDPPVLEERPQSRAHYRHGEPRQRALVCKVPSAQRHAPDITLGLLRSRPSMD